MTKKTISELDDIGTTQLNSALAAIEQGGSTFKGPIRPNPPTEFNVTSEQQLLDQFDDLSGGILIPAGSTTLYIDSGFNLTTPIKIAPGANLEITSQVAEIALTYSGVGLGAMIQNETTGEIGSLRLTNVDFTSAGQSLNDFIDVTTTSQNSVVINSVNLTQFKSLGTINTGLLFMTNCVALGFEQGFKFDNILAVSIQDSGAQQINPTVAATNPTLYSFLAETVASGVTLNRVLLNDPFVVNDNSLVFFDPNATEGTSFALIRSSNANGPFYQPGTDLEISNAAVNGSEVTFTTGSAATGIVTIGAPIVGDTVTVNGLVYTGVSGTKSNDTEFSIDVSVTAIATDLADSITNDVRFGITVPSIDQTATSLVGVVTITADIGALGNTIDLASSSPSQLTVSGPFLTGGAGIANNGLSANDRVSLRGFSEPTYNDVFFVDSATALTFDVTLPFVSNVPGFMDVTIKSVADNGSGFTEFTTATAHGLSVGKAVVLSNFSFETTYNGTQIVTAVSGLTFDTATAFGTITGTDTGTLSAASLDSTDPLVTAQDNVQNDDSMTTITIENPATTAIDLTTVTANTPQEITSDEWTFADAERVVSQGNGQIKITDVSKRTYRVTISSTLKAIGAATLGIRLVKNFGITDEIIGTAFPDRILPNNAIAFIIQDYLVELSLNDTLNITAISDASSDIQISFARMVLGRA